MQFPDEKFARRYLLSNEEENFCSDYLDDFANYVLSTGNDPPNWFYEAWKNLKQQTSDREFVRRLREQREREVREFINYHLQRGMAE